MALQEAPNRNLYFYGCSADSPRYSYQVSIFHHRSLNSQETYKFMYVPDYIARSLIITG